MNDETFRIYFMNLQPEYANLDRHWHNLADNERVRAHSFNRNSAKQRYIAVHGRVRQMLSDYTGLSPGKILIERSVFGKPYLANLPEISFNISHSGDILIIAIAQNCQLGVDIEHCKPRKGLIGLVDRCFAGIEADWLHSFPEPERLREFYRFWTRKEAFVKATGFGISLGLNQCVINPRKPTTWYHVPSACGPASKWHVCDLDLNPGICAAVAADRPINQIKVN